MKSNSCYDIIILEEREIILRIFYLSNKEDRQDIDLLKKYKYIKTNEGR